MLLDFFPTFIFMVGDLVCNRSAKTGQELSCGLCVSPVNLKGKGIYPVA